MAFRFQIRLGSHRGGRLGNGWLLKGKLLAKPESPSINGLHTYSIHVHYCIQFCAVGDLRHWPQYPDKTFNYPLSVPFLALCSLVAFGARLHSAIPIKLSYSCLGNFPRIKTCGAPTRLANGTGLTNMFNLVPAASRAQQKLYLYNFHIP